MSLGFLFVGTVTSIFSSALFSSPPPLPLRDRTNMSMQIYYTSYQNGQQRCHGGYRPGHPPPPLYLRNVAGRTAPPAMWGGGGGGLLQLFTGAARDRPVQKHSSK